MVRPLKQTLTALSGTLSLSELGGGFRDLVPGDITCNQSAEFSVRTTYAVVPILVGTVCTPQSSPRRSSSRSLDLKIGNDTVARFAMAAMEGIVDGSGSSVSVVHCLPAVEDKFNGMVVQISKFLSKDVAAFRDSLLLSLELWRSEKKKGIWLKLPIEYCDFVPPAINEGKFEYHHAEKTYVMLLRWLGDGPSALPANASHNIGVGAFVLNVKGEILAVKERYGMFQDKWKMPTGGVHQGEDVSAGAIREVKEETGIDTEFIEVIGFRESHGKDLDVPPFGKSDLYILFVLRPLTSTITVQTAELVDAKWIPLDEYKAQNYLSERKMLGRMLNACIESSTAPARKGFKQENVQAGTTRAPQIFYNNFGP